MPRERTNAVISDPEEVVDRALRVVQDGTLLSVGGDVIELNEDTLCLHGDTPGSGLLAARLRNSLESAGVKVMAPSMEG